MFEELRAASDANGEAGEGAHTTRKTLGQAVTQIVVADVSMSLDNVLAVAVPPSRTFPPSSSG